MVGVGLGLGLGLALGLGSGSALGLGLRAFGPAERDVCGKRRLDGVADAHRCVENVEIAWLGLRG